MREVLLVRERERERYREREREREKDGSDVTIVALKLAMNLHFPLPKIRTIGDKLTLSLAKNSHFSILPSHFPSFPSRRGHHGMVALKFAMSSHFPLPNYRKRGSASYIVREVLLVRERDTEREREKDGSDVTIVALKLAMN